MNDISSKERQILMTMRKVLASIIKDTTPEHRDMKHPLSDMTIDQVRSCLGMIAARERELADEAGAGVEKPYFTDEKRTADVVSIDSIKPGPKK
ncbi:segregation and condensation protein A [Solemya elarraichensis gill symbiont]|uniref:Segregation and condensation protein A n=1 Tax=Solemya elarraichensis gill symbiont TaxID=1918949 RepID=A0A1T2L7Y8_9GAMM|nr:segregation and condensation protein A [Solemya elarraichensis gill symbiont]OOZ41225.1 segregation and condensation protein A [Solemya elarraichensis gill symbiont]